MSGGFPFFADVCNGMSVGANTASSGGTDVTSSASANTKGSWVQLIASTAGDCDLITINTYWHTFNGSLSVGSVDIGVGAAASEVIVIPDLVVTNNAGNNNSTASLILPVSIPAGSRVAARSQTGLASAIGIFAICQLYDSGFAGSYGISGFDVLGYTSSTSLGTAVTASGSAGVKGSYSQITAATTKDYIGIFGMLDNQASSTGAGDFCLLDVAIGPGGSEQVIMPNIFLVRGGQTSPFPASIGFTPIQIPSGTRLAARMQSNVGSLVVGLTLYGAYL